jgi:hypothetical protein
VKVSCGGAGEDRGGRGSFADLERLIEQLIDAPLTELGKPLPADKHLPNWAKHCPGCHNRALLDCLNQLPPCEGEEGLPNTFSNQ